MARCTRRPLAVACAVIPQSLRSACPLSQPCPPKDCVGANLMFPLTNCNTVGFSQRRGVTTSPQPNQSNCFRAQVHGAAAFNNRTVSLAQPPPSRANASQHTLTTAGPAVPPPEASCARSVLLLRLLDGLGHPPCSSEWCMVRTHGWFQARRGGAASRYGPKTQCHSPPPQGTHTCSRCFRRPACPASSSVPAADHARPARTAPEAGWAMSGVSLVRAGLLSSRAAAVGSSNGPTATPARSTLRSQDPDGHVNRHRPCSSWRPAHPWAGPGWVGRGRSRGGWVWRGRSGCAPPHQGSLVGRRPSCTPPLAASTASPPATPSSCRPHRRVRHLPLGQARRAAGAAAVGGAAGRRPSDDELARGLRAACR
jgi:hypothetical protein